MVFQVVYLAHRSFSYPLAYSFIVLPLSITRWLAFNSHHHVPSAATFFGIIIFNLSGAVNVVLFLFFKPQLLLFARPKLRQPDIALVPAGNSSKVFTETENSQNSPEPTTTAQDDDSEAALSSRVSSTRTSTEI